MFGSLEKICLTSRILGFKNRIGRTYTIGQHKYQLKILGYMAKN